MSEHLVRDERGVLRGILVARTLFGVRRADRAHRLGCGDPVRSDRGRVEPPRDVGGHVVTLARAEDLPAHGAYLLVDELNIVFIVLNTFVAFTTSVFNAGYIGHELATGRLTPAYLRFYHAMYQLLVFAMNLALVANNIGLMWVAIELATLTTVLMVGIYRTHEALEAAWKYFILGSVGIALALYLYARAQRLSGALR